MHNHLEVGIRKTVGLLFFLAGLLGPAAAICLGETAEVTHNVNLRSDPSTDNPPIRLLHPTEKVQLLEPGKTAGYFHVQTSLAEEGWVWSKNVRILETTPTPTPTAGPVITATRTPSPEVTATPTPTPGAAAAIDQTWEKPAPVEISYTSTNGNCPPAGKAGDSATNLRKNRVDAPASYHEVTYEAVATFRFPWMRRVAPAGQPHISPTLLGSRESRSLSRGFSLTT